MIWWNILQGSISMTDRNKCPGQETVQDQIFSETLRELEERPEILLLKQYRQHKIADTFTHSHNVAVCAHYLAVRWKKQVNMKELATGAMLHDYYLYNVKESGLTDYQHGIRHPVTALKNAEKIFELSEKEKNIIVSHMWPLPFSKKPACMEAWLVSMADKYCAFQEMYRGVIHIEDILK